MTSLADFGNVKGVIADPVRFKLKLGIGEDAYASLRRAKVLQSLWDVAGVAAVGMNAAKLPVVASVLAPASFWTAIGLAPAAATPLGWVIAAAFVSGGAYYGVLRLAKMYRGSRVAEIPKFINTPIDLLGASLLDLMGTLAIKFAGIDGSHHEKERQATRRFFLEEWGFDREYLDLALKVLEENSGRATLSEAVAVLVRFSTDNPDCNLSSIRAAIVEMLQEIAEADGRIDEREEWALEHVKKEFSRAKLSRIRRFFLAARSGLARTLGWPGRRFRKTRGKRK